MDEVPGAIRDRRYDLAVVSEILDCFETPALAATFSRLQAIIGAEADWSPSIDVPAIRNGRSRPPWFMPSSGRCRGCAPVEDRSTPRLLAARPRAMTEPYRLLIVGGGPAGLAAARSYREIVGDGRVAIVTDECRLPYSRPRLTKELLRGETSEEVLPIESERWLERQQVDLIGGRVVALHHAKEPRPRRRARARLRLLSARARSLANPSSRARQRPSPGPGTPHAGPTARAPPST